MSVVASRPLRTRCSVTPVTQDGRHDSEKVNGGKVDFVSGRISPDHRAVSNGVRLESVVFSTPLFLKVMFDLVLLHHFLPCQEPAWQQSALSDNYIHETSARSNNDVWQHRVDFSGRPGISITLTIREDTRGQKPTTCTAWSRFKTNTNWRSRVCLFESSSSSLLVMYS